MKLSVNLKNLKSANWLDVHQVHRYQHPAMATIFEAFVFHPDRRYAQQAVQSAFNEIDTLEQELSRFIENSDINRINQLAIHEPIKVGPDTFTCLQICKQIYEQTYGCFDISVGMLVDLWKSGEAATKRTAKTRLQIIEKTGMEYLVLNNKDYSVQLLKTGLQLDLGGFGKGYALDRMAAILSEWGITCAMVHSGFSTVLALAAPGEENGWPISITHPLSHKIIKHISVVHSAVSGSGLQKGAHIIDPRTSKPVQNRLAAWSVAQSAAVADALSTAFMIMPIRQIKKYILQHPEISACVILKKESGIVSFGLM